MAEERTELGAHGILDPVAFGALLKAARVARRMTAQQVASELRRRWGLNTSSDTLGYYERGQREVPTSVFFALVLTLRPRGGFDHFAPALRDDARRELRLLEE
jgi:transcriptional regulator with XRE-family HTH domain